VFEIDLGPHGCGHAQIVKVGAVFQISVLSEIHPEPLPVSRLKADAPLGFIWTTDGDYKRGVWRIIGNLPTPRSVPEPRSKVGLGGRVAIEDSQQKFIRVATAEDEAFYDFRLSVSSPSVATFILAHHGLAGSTPDRRHYANYQTMRMGDPPR
jgi:hypothetical protein